MIAGIGHIGLLAILSLLAWCLPVMGSEAAPHPCRLAIVAGPGLWRDGALLTKLFAQEAGVEVLERDELEKILAEQELAFRLGPGSLQACRLAGADGVLFLERLEHEGAPYVAFRLVRAAEGVILDGDVLPERFSEVMEMPAAIHRICLPQLPRLTMPLADLVPVGMVNVRAVVSTPEGELTERLLTSILAQHLMQAPQVCLLERRRMGALQFEKTLKEAKGQSFWSSAWLMDGTVAPQKGGDGWDVEMRALDARRTVVASVSGICRASDANRVGGELAARLIEKVTQARPGASWDPAAEAAYYRAEARWAVDHGLYDAGMSAAETALTLNPERDVEAAYLFIAAAGGRTFANTLDWTGYPSVHEHGFSMPKVVTEQDLEHVRLAIAACRRELDLGPKSIPVRWGIAYHWAVQFRRAWAAGMAMSREAQRKKELAPLAQALREECRQLGDLIRIQAYRENNEQVLQVLGYRYEEEQRRKAEAEAEAGAHISGATTSTTRQISAQEKARREHQERLGQLKRELMGKIQFPPLPRLDHDFTRIDLAQSIGMQRVIFRHACQTGRGREIGLVLAVTESVPVVLLDPFGRSYNSSRLSAQYTAAWLDPDTGQAEVWPLADSPGYDIGHPHFSISAEWVAIVDQKLQLWCGSRKGRSLRKICTLPGITYEMMGPISIHGNHVYVAMGSRFYNHPGWNHYGAGFVGGPPPLTSAGVLRVELPEGRLEILASARRRPGRNGLEDRDLYHVEGLITEFSGKGLWLVTYNKPSCDLHYLDLESGASRHLRRFPSWIGMCTGLPGTIPLLHGNHDHTGPLIVSLGRESVDFLLARKTEVIQYQLPRPRWLYDELNTKAELTVPASISAYDGSNLFVLSSLRLDVYRPGHRSPTAFWLSKERSAGHMGIFVDDRHLLVASPNEGIIWRYDRAAILAACDRVLEPPGVRLKVVPGSQGRTAMALRHPVAGVEIRYTLDGTLPEADSPLYAKPFLIPSAPTMLVARAFDPAGKRTPSGPTYQVLEPLPYVPSVALDAPPVPGLQVERFDGAWSWLPDFDTLTAADRLVVERPRFDLPGRPEAYALRFTGFLLVPREGEYTFRLCSDDGSMLLLGNEVVANNDGWHPPSTVVGKFHLNRGGRMPAVIVGHDLHG
jgi:hypothetical protein